MLKYAMIVLLASASTKGCNNEAKNTKEDEIISEKMKKTTIEETKLNTTLHDIYALKSIAGQEVDKTFYPMGIPNLEINLTENKINGYSGCNNFFGEIKHITDKKIELGPIAATKKFCQGINEQLLFEKLNEVDEYKREGLELFLYKQDTLLLTFKKVD